MSILLRAALLLLLFLNTSVADLCLDKVMSLNAIHVFIRRIPDTNFYILIQRTGEAWLVLEDPTTGGMVNTGQRLAFGLEDRIDIGSSFRELVYHPDWENNHKVYAYFACDPAKCPIPPDDCDVTGRPRPFECTPESMLWNAQLSEFTLEFNPLTGLFDVGNERVLLTMGYPDRFHGGGGMDFDTDGYLILAIGDGAGYRNINGWSQDMTNRRGKVIRIDVDTTGGQPLKNNPLTKPYGIPNDNPYYDNDNGWRRETWAIGMRQPYRCIRDKPLDMFFCGSIGEDAVETLWIVKKNENYGWAMFEGTYPFSLYPYNDFENALAPGWTPEMVTPPVMEWCRGSMCGEVQRSSAIIAGDVYRGDKSPEYYGRFISGDWDSSAPYAYVTDIEPDAPYPWNTTIVPYQCVGCTTFFEGYLEHIETAANGDLLFLFDNGLMRMVDPAQCTGGGGGIPVSRPKQPFIEVPYHYRAFTNPPEISSANGELDTTLTVTQERHSAGLVSDAGPETVLEFNTRLYNGEFPGPTLRFKAGDVLKVKLVNNLDEPLVPYSGTDWNQYDKAQVTNLHTHGLHVSPKGNADNVWIEVEPQMEFDYLYEPHADHAPGLSYYHSHLHGSGYMQVQGGLYGALIVDLPDDPIYDELRNLPEQIVLLGLVNANGLDDSESYETLNLVSGSTFPGGLTHYYEDYQGYALVNGIFQPTMTFGMNETQHFRVTNTASEGFLLQIDGDCTIWELARDAIYLDEPIQVELVFLGPANRADLLVTCSSPGLFSMYTNTTYLAKEIKDSDAVKQTVLYIEVTAGIATPTYVPGITLPPRPAYLPDLRYTETMRIYRGQDISMDYGEKISGQKLECRGCISEVWKVGRAYEVNISTTGFHPLHMHINHFQIINWQYNGETPDTVLFREGEFRDTVPLISGLSVTVRFFLDTYTGAALSHCHVAHHADKGMMRMQYIADDDEIDFRNNVRVRSLYLDDPHPIEKRVISVWVSDDCTTGRPECTEDDEELYKNSFDENNNPMYTLPIIVGTYLYWTFDRGMARDEAGMFVELRATGAYTISGAWSAPFNPDPLYENTNFISELPVTVNSPGATTDWLTYEFFFRHQPSGDFDPQNLFAASLGFVLTDPLVAGQVEVRSIGFLREIELEDDIHYEIGQLPAHAPTPSPGEIGGVSPPNGDITERNTGDDVAVIAGTLVSLIVCAAIAATLFVRMRRRTSGQFYSGEAGGGESIAVGVKGRY